MQLLFLRSIFSEDALKATGWTLIHSLWQGLLAAVLAGIIIACTRRSAARLRYNLLTAVLGLFLVATAITFYTQKRNSAGEKIVPVLAGRETGFFAADIQYKGAAVETPTAIDTFVAYFNTHADVIVFTWAVCFLIHCTKLFTGLAGIRRFRTYKTHLPAKEWQEKLDQLANTLGIYQSISLVESELVKIPAAIGYFKPVILVPLGLLSNLPADQVEAILLHELAHIRRRDYLTNILQRLTEAVFFFNPALLWISSLIRQEREACCDDIVVSTMHHKASYLDALISFQEYSVAGPACAMGISSKKNYLLNRVKRMLTRENKKLDLMEKILLIAGVAAVTAFTFIPQKEIKDRRKATVNEFKKALSVMPGLPAATMTIGKGYPAKPALYLLKSRNKTNVSPKIELIDTVPSPLKEKTEYDNLKFKSISHDQDNNGTTNTERIEVTTEDGKTYKITRLNDKVSSIVIDGKNVPENEMDKYAPLIQRIDLAIQESRAQRQKDMEQRKADMQQRRDDRQRMMVERQREMQKERTELNDERRKDFDRERERMENQRRQMEKEMKGDNLKREENQKRFNMERERLEDQRRQMEKEMKEGNLNRGEYQKRFEMERKRLEDQRREMENKMKKENLNREEHQKQFNMERRKLEDQRRQMNREIERVKRQRSFLDSNGREIILEDNKTLDDNFNYALKNPAVPDKSSLAGSAPFNYNNNNLFQVNTKTAGTTNRTKMMTDTIVATIAGCGKSIKVNEKDFYYALQYLWNTEKPFINATLKAKPPVDVKAAEKPQMPPAPARIHHKRVTT